MFAIHSKNKLAFKLLKFYVFSNLNETTDKNDNPFTILRVGVNVKQAQFP